MPSPCANRFCPRNDGSESGCMDHHINAVDLLCPSYFSYNDSLHKTLQILKEENDLLRRMNRNLTRTGMRLAKENKKLRANTHNV